LKEDHGFSLKSDTPNWSSSDFNNQLKAGKKLVILNDMVLDITKFINYHPGGKFVLNINSGRDISKFFYGGYCLEGNGAGGPAHGYNHSNYAKMIVNSLVVGLYQVETEPKIVKCRVNQ